MELPLIGQAEHVTWRRGRSLEKLPAKCTDDLCVKVTLEMTNNIIITETIVSQLDFFVGKMTAIAHGIM